jgi:hypothetical protein
LQKSDEEDELENEMFLEALEQLVEDSLPAERVARWGGSTPGKRYVFRERELCHARLFKDYFDANPTYDDATFWRRFRMRRELFLSIVERVSAFDPWFVQRSDAVGRLGLSALQKCTVALRMLAYGIPADATDEYCRVGESTTTEALKRFVIAIRGCFENTFLRQPSREDLKRQI